MSENHVSTKSNQLSSEITGFIEIHLNEHVTHTTINQLVQHEYRPVITEKSVYNYRDKIIKFLLYNT